LAQLIRARFGPASSAAICTLDVERRESKSQRSLWWIGGGARYSLIQDGWSLMVAAASETPHNHFLRRVGIAGARDTALLGLCWGGMFVAATRPVGALKQEKKSCTVRMSCSCR
jgi:hypothetical protein